jgi:DNA-binding PadR family transcriptional regulator
VPTIKVTYKDRSRGVATVHVPQAELLILNTLSDQKLTAAQLVRQGGQKIPLGGVYTSLNRLSKRGLVVSEESSIQAHDISLKRVYYVTTFDTVEEVD